MTDTAALTVDYDLLCKAWDLSEAMQSIPLEARITAIQYAVNDWAGLSPGRGVPRRRVEEWLTDVKYDPYLDLVALDRAERFDWAVIERLTHIERRVFEHRLAGEDLSNLPAARASGWKNLTEEQRANLLRIADRRRKSGSGPRVNYRTSPEILSHAWAA